MTNNFDVDRLFRRQVTKYKGVYIVSRDSMHENQEHTNKAFSEKWTKSNQQERDENWKQIQFDRYLSLYGFLTEQNLQEFIASKKVVLDAGCGLGYKAAWFASLNPHALIIAMDYSEAIFFAQKRFVDFPNMIFIQGDIADTPFNDSVFDFINCDQVLHHTESPHKTLQEFRRILMNNAVLNTYVYSKKALIRELIDDHFREYSKELTQKQIWELSEQLTHLGQALSKLDIEIDVPDIPLLGIKGGKQDLQRFIYWNFLKCFWNEQMGWDVSVNCNFDWYSPSNAFRFDRKEFTGLLQEAGFKLDFLHSEEACHSGRFRV